MEHQRAGDARPRVHDRQAAADVPDRLRGRLDRRRLGGQRRRGVRAAPGAESRRAVAAGGWTGGRDPQLRRAGARARPALGPLLASRLADGPGPGHLRIDPGRRRLGRAPAPRPPAPRDRLGRAGLPRRPGRLGRAARRNGRDLQARAPALPRRLLRRGLPHGRRRLPGAGRAVRLGPDPAGGQGRPTRPSGRMCWRWRSDAGFARSSTCPTPTTGSTRPRWRSARTTSTPTPRPRPARPPARRLALDRQPELQRLWMAATGPSQGQGAESP